MQAAQERRADHPARREGAVRGRRRLDQETGRRQAARRRRREAHPGIPGRHQGLARQQQVAGGSERRGPGRAAVPQPPEPDRPDRRDAAAPQGARHLLPRRGAARGGLALHQRAPGRQPRPQLRLGARQSRRALRRRRLRRHGEGERTAEEGGRRPPRGAGAGGAPSRLAPSRPGGVGGFWGGPRGPGGRQGRRGGAGGVAGRARPRGRGGGGKNRRGGGAGAGGESACRSSRASR